MFVAIRSYEPRNSLNVRNPRSIMSRIISSDHRSPNTSTDAFRGHPDLRAKSVFFFSIFKRIPHSYLLLTSDMARLSRLIFRDLARPNAPSRVSKKQPLILAPAKTGDHHGNRSVSRFQRPVRRSLQVVRKNSWRKDRRNYDLRRLAHGLALPAGNAQPTHSRPSGRRRSSPHGRRRSSAELFRA